MILLNADHLIHCRVQQLYKIPNFDHFYESKANVLSDVGIGHYTFHIGDIFYFQICLGLLLSRVVTMETKIGNFTVCLRLFFRLIVYQ